MSSYHILGAIILELRNYKESFETFKKVFDLRKLVLGEKHPDTLQSMNNFAVGLKRLGKNNEAKTQFTELAKLAK